jgi:hypothetical protein
MVKKKIKPSKSFYGQDFLILLLSVVILAGGLVVGLSLVKSSTAPTRAASYYR